MSFSASPSATVWLALNPSRPARNSSPEAFETPGGSELEEERERLRHPEPPVEARSQHALELVERVGIADTDELRRRLDKPVGQLADRMDVDLLETCVAFGLGRQMRDVELVAHVDVGRKPRLDDRGDRRARELELDRRVEQDAAVGLGDECPLVADDRLAELGRLDHTARRLQHPPGRDDDVDPRLLGAAQRGERPGRTTRSSPIRVRSRSVAITATSGGKTGTGLRGP